MARTEIEPESVSRSGLNATQTAAIADGHFFKNDGRVICRCINNDASSKTFTFQTPATLDGLALADLDVAVPAGEFREVGPFPPGIYNQSDGSVYVDYSSATSGLIEVKRV